MPEPRPTKRVRWYRLMHASLPRQMAAGATLKSVVEVQWRLARAGIQTRLVRDWIDIPREATWPPVLPQGTDDAAR